jgi:hypothetical protein
MMEWNELEKDIAQANLPLTVEDNLQNEGHQHPESFKNSRTSDSQPFRPAEFIAM